MSPKDSEPSSKNSHTIKTIADLFDGLPYRHFPAKQIIYYQEDPIHHIYYIISGYVRMYNITPSGNTRTLILLGPGEGIPLIQTQTAQYFYDALTDVEAAYGTYDEIIQRFMSDPNNMGIARQSNIKLMKRMMEQLEVVSTDSSDDKVGLMLSFLAKHYGDERDEGCKINIKLTHQELANMVNLTRETVSQKIAILERKKKIKTDKDGYYIVLDTGK